MALLPFPAAGALAGRPAFRLAAIALAALIAGCAAGPDYVAPTLDIPAAYKEAGPWKAAEPRPAQSGEAWWAVYHDATLDTLMRDAALANQDLRVAEAQYRQARALADEARSRFFPTVGVDATAQRARSNTTGAARTAGAYTLGLSASWEPDLWGSVRRSVEAGEAGALASEYDVAAANLSIQTTLAQDYLALRITDQLRDLYASTIAAYEKALALTRAQHAAGVTLLSDVALAETQLTTAQAQGVDLETTRAQLEHAIAVLTGRSPAQFSLAPIPPGQYPEVALPATPPGLPSELLEHRPDIAAAERRAAAANAQIGVARAAYFPALTLGASGGFAAVTLGTLFDTPGRVWALGATLAETVFDGGLRRAQDAQAVAAYDAAVAGYKQTVLSGFQQVEDNLAVLRILDQESALQARAVEASLLAERLSLTQYRAGTTSYLNVITAQALSLNNRRAAVTLRGRQVAASIGLIAATGGGWNVAATSNPPVATSATQAPNS